MDWAGPDLARNIRGLIETTTGEQCHLKQRQCSGGQIKAPFKFVVPVSKSSRMGVAWPRARSEPTEVS